MTLYSITPVSDESEYLLFELEMLGSQANPWYLCQLFHKRKGSPLPAGPTVTFFLLEGITATEAVDRALGLLRALTGPSNPFPTIEDALKEARRLAAA